MPATAKKARDFSRYLPPLVTDPRRKTVNILTVSTEVPEVVRTPFSFHHLTETMSERLEMPCNSSAAWLDKMLKVEFFRGVSWTDLPVVSDPWYRISVGSATLARGMEEKPGVAEFFDAHYAYLHHDNRETSDPGVMARDRYLSGYIHSRMFDGLTPVYVATRRSDDIMTTTAAEMMEPAAGTMRLEYSYHFNMMAIAGKLVERFRADTSSYCLRPWMYGNDYLAGATVSGFYHPLALQLLYALKRRGPVSAQSFAASKTPLDDLFLTRDRTVYWPGTGKYPGVEIRKDSEAAQAEKSLFLLGLVERTDQQHQFRISEAGERFLELLHPDCEDPDILNRWADCETGLISGKYSDNVDAWLMRFFSKLKTRVNAIKD